MPGFGGISELPIAGLGAGTALAGLGLPALAGSAGLSGGALPRLPVSYRSSAMFYWSAWDGVLTPRTLQAPTFLRSSSATFIDSEGKVARVAADQPRWSAHAESGVFGVLLETVISANSCLWSEDFAQWAVNGTPALLANAIRCGLLNLALITDDDGGVAEGYARSDVLLSGGSTAVSVFMKQGTSPPAGGSLIALTDAGATVRLDMVVTWTNGVPSATGVGTFLGRIACADGVYRLLFKTAGTSAAGNATVSVRPANTAAQTGNVYVGGVQVEDNRSIPSSYIPTGAAAVFREPETLLWPFLGLIRDCTLYAKCVDIGSGVAGSMFIRIGDEGADPWLRIASATIGPATDAAWDSGTGPIGASVAAGSSFGQAFEMRGSLSPSGLVTVGYATLGGAEATGTQQAVVPPFNTPWGVQQIRVGQGGGDAILLNQIALYPGVLTIEQLRKRG